ncbi:hypothetical protein Tco_0942064 [Tanacetum coccineum]|uniref:Uncharacterized protein n=1 Tax=Tanacetum coccineum TaxID=301880 RepID=A0ABQ5DTL4_9ASTR
MPSTRQPLKVLYKEDLKGTRIEHGFKRAFMSLFGQDNDTFTSTMLLNVDQLQKQLDKDEFQEDESMTAFWVINRQFQKFIDSQFTLDYDSQMTDGYFVEYTRIEMQKQESKVELGKALDDGLVITESSGTESEKKDTSSSQLSANDKVDFGHNGAKESKVSETITSVSKVETSNSETSNDKVEMPKIKTVKMSEPIIEEWEPDSEDDEIVVKPKIVTKNSLKPSLKSLNLLMTGNRNFVRQAKKNPRKLNRRPRGNKMKLEWYDDSEISITVLTKSGLVSLNTAKSVSTAQSRKTINGAMPTTYSYYKAYSSVKRPFNKKTANYNRYFYKRVNTVKSKRVNTARPKEEVNTVKASASWVWKPKHEELDHVSKSNSASKTLTRYDYVDALGRFKSVLAWDFKRH